MDELANLLMSWYYAGYYTGSYSRQPTGSAAGAAAEQGRGGRGWGREGPGWMGPPPSASPERGAPPWPATGLPRYQY